MNLLNLFNSLTVLQKSLAVSILSVIFFVGSAGASYSMFSKGSISLGSIGLSGPLPGPASSVTEDPGEPRTEACPLNGNMHTKKAKEAWEQRRPLAVMIENHQESRPQSGLSTADVVYEAVAEGGITRFMALFYCNLGDTQVGPVRSARTYFLDWLGEYDGSYAHVGGANTPGPADALGQIIKYGVKDLNQFSIGFPTFWRDYQRLGRPVATEHTMYSTTQKLWSVAAKKGFLVKDERGVDWNKFFVPWKFKDEDKTRGTVGKIEVNFWQNKGDYQVNWEYDGGCNCYKRSQGSVAHTDLNTKNQLAAKLVIIQFQRESNANDGYENNAHMLYGTIGKGKVLVFQDGNVSEGTWNKSSRVVRSKYLDQSGKEINLNRGQIWIQTVPEGAKVTY
ncbi:hypothetical protein A3H85_02785 [Candidatus Daviesbacteria bacterium RIFCSPLOWO2_02_FULL_40_8]|uniref:Lipoprotein YerB n=1 Tax=Candidatus Daviesbacteria bacterium RIFCSPLOWO2_01_FULL_40_24 TaxID=1797787 RepID=A0A1F5MIK3_9BACT|nr:MAG: hypothetical protein A2780_03505 [Candidatus Daviesbacteria bacterium RIFCSPHIGHO2_01_FULL_41_45]OGE34210.1 MAG: hypothetical protein A3C32_00590 [Candidatus Daviesbacteria bacterium RIFCSPHIGHO2_02_FULL_41_14]OGE65194.1 MAG: hypothetical protein A3B49_01540 [Candidatus Daviesbacteria bacterium RIFCSPLOWO2_01_FULL_40_24]OGE67117.1 MAG: hypothetical protein A3H85_02785 [Candidatus Daviesbacteria bacterium RIFCSPLOWO2_02_FULL_40_8]